jgi:hypothetical protein
MQQGVKDRRAVIGSEDAIEQDGVQVRIKSQIGANSLRNANGSTLTDDAIDIAHAALVETQD